MIIGGMIGKLHNVVSLDMGECLIPPGQFATLFRALPSLKVLKIPDKEFENFRRFTAGGDQPHSDSVQLSFLHSRGMRKIASPILTSGFSIHQGSRE